MLRRSTHKPLVESLENRVVLTPLGGHAVVVANPGPPVSLELPAEVGPQNLPEQASTGIARAIAGPNSGE